MPHWEMGMKAFPCNAFMFTRKQSVSDVLVSGRRMLEIRQLYFDSLDSTNEELKRRAADGAEEGLVVSAGSQHAGKGRSGRRWQSPVGESIATSLLLRPELPCEKLSSLTLVAAMAVLRAVQGLYDLDAMIKWPNDIVIDGKKVCGILTEMAAKEGKAEYVIIGIGVNVHNHSFSEDIQKTATSLDLELEKTGKGRGGCKVLTQRIWQEFIMLYQVYGLTGDLSVLMEEYNRYLVNRNQQVKVLDPLGNWEGTARGIDETGALLVETPDDVRRVDAGEVSVRGVYGYV
jgi:BirA family biotin operon repressor/biotin-[acetyl-CoA-carboxylase] ligase